MTVYFDLEGISFSASGVKHVCQGKPDFIMHSVHVQGSVADLRKILDADFLERVNEAASEAAYEEAEPSLSFPDPFPDEPFSRPSLAVELAAYGPQVKLIPARPRTSIDEDVEALR